MLTHADGSPATWDGLVRQMETYWRGFREGQSHERVVLCREYNHYGNGSSAWCERFVVEGTDRCTAHQPGQPSEE